jgi:hypothetical protein
LQTYTETFTVSADGTNTLEYYSVDTNNNEEETKTATVKIDKSAPSSSSDSTSTWSDTPTTVHLSSSDALSGLAGIRYAVNGSVAATYTGGIGVAAEGTTTITYAGIDNVGNVEETQTATVRLDFTAPVTTSNAADSYTNTATITLSPSDVGGSGVAARCGAWMAASGLAGPCEYGVQQPCFYADGRLGMWRLRRVTFYILTRFEQTDPPVQGTWHYTNSSCLSGGPWLINRNPQYLVQGPEPHGSPRNPFYGKASVSMAVGAGSRFTRTVAYQRVFAPACWRRPARSHHGQGQEPSSTLVFV